MYSFSSRVRYSETDEKGQLTVTSIMNYLQDCATFHGEDVGLGVEYHTARHHAWMMASYEILIHELPKMGDRIEIMTWPYQFRGPYGFRCFEIRSPEGKLYVQADSQWFLFDTAERRPARVQPEDCAGYQAEGDQRLDMPPFERKISAPPGSEWIPGEPVVIGRHHLDTNHHVNNAQYVEIAREAVESVLEKSIVTSEQPASDSDNTGKTGTEMSADKAESAGPSRLDAQFKKMALLGDTVYPFLHVEGDAETPVREITAELRDEDGSCYAIVRLR